MLGLNQTVPYIQCSLYPRVHKQCGQNRGFKCVLFKWMFLRPGVTKREVTVYSTHLSYCTHAIELPIRPHNIISNVTIIISEITTEPVTFWTTQPETTTSTPDHLYSTSPPTTQRDERRMRKTGKQSGL